ncbi:glucose-6-phosphate isomerase [Desulfovibrio sp. OttesenSCG-928-I05]|nr:glucose-6-phosphate isomerase [Desulfovibrio sp. OttesenSCG-928-I05]
MSDTTAAHVLDWTRSRIGRLSGVGMEAGGHAARAGEIGGRLAKDLASGILPFITMPYRAELEKKLPEALEGIKHCEHMLLLGIGGSALGARALQKAFRPEQDRPGYKGPWLWIADNVDAETLEAWFASLPPEKTAVVVISKSGGTIETLSQYFLAKEWLHKALGENWKKNVVMVTDDAKGYLREEATRESMVSLPVPDYLGGRFSALSAVGMLPAAFLGMRWKDLLAGAASVAAPLVEDPSALKSHPAWDLAVWNRQLMENGYSQLIFFSYIPLWSYLGAWFAQLWGESLGKSGKGSMPLPAVGVTDQHSLQQMFLDGPKDKGCLFLHSPSLSKGRAFSKNLPEQWAFLRGRNFGDLLEAEGLGTRMALSQCKVPMVEMRLASTDEMAAGKMMMLLEMTTLLTGWLLDIDPLDQPAVELGKRLANARLGAPGYSEESAALASFLAGKGRVSEF